MSLYDRLALLAGLRSAPRRNANRPRPLGELLEARQVLSATGFAGNECAPELDISAVTIPSVVAGETITLDLPALGATLIDTNEDGSPTGDALRWLADPDTGIDFPEGATLSEDGVFSWTPTVDDKGSHSVTILGIDAGTPALADSETFTLEVLDNGAPDLEAIADQSVTAADELVLTVTASDPDVGDTLSFSLGGDSPADATITKTGDTTAEIRWTPGDDDVGTVEFEVLVTDDGSPQGADSETFDVTVAERNLSPDIAPIADRDVTEGVELVVSVSATDPNTGQTLILYLDANNSPEGATITSTGDGTAEVRWTPAEGETGDVGFTVLVSDNGVPPLVDSESFTVTVVDAPEPPEFIVENTPEIAFAGVEYKATFEATDPNAGDILTYAKAAAPAGATVTKIDNNHAEFTWTPEASDIGSEFAFAVSVTDDGTPTQSDTSFFSVTVSEAPIAPVLDTIADQTGAVGVELVVPLSGFDSNTGDTLTFSIDPADLPTGAQIVTLTDTTAEFRYTPDADAGTAGSVTATIVVTDAGGLTDSQQFTITIDTEAPHATGPAGTFTSTFSSIVLEFDEPMSAGTFLATSYKLEVIGGMDDGLMIPITSVTMNDDSTAELAVDAALADNTYRLTLDEVVITDLAGNLLATPRAFAFSVDTSV